MWKGLCVGAYIYPLINICGEGLKFRLTSSRSAIVGGVAYSPRQPANSHAE